MYELYDKNKKYEIADVIKQLDDIAFPSDIYEKIYETTNNKQNNDNDIEMIDSNDEKISSNVENIPSHNGKNSLRDQNIPQDSKTVVVTEVKNKNLEIANTDWINYSVKKLNRKDNEKNARKRSIEITQTVIMDEINKKKIEMRKQRNTKIIMERRNKIIENQGQRDQKSKDTKKINMKEKEKELEKNKTTNILINTKGNKDSRDDSRKSNSQKSGDSTKGKKNSREMVKGSEKKEKDSHIQKRGNEKKVVCESKAKKKNQSTKFTDSTKNKGNVRKLSRKYLKISRPKGKVSSSAYIQNAEVSKEKEVKKIRIKKEYKEENEENKLKGDNEKYDNLSDAHVFFEQKKKFEGKMVCNQEIVDLNKYFEESPPIKTGKHNSEKKDKYWFMPWYLEYYANPSKKTNDNKISIAEGSDWRMLPVLCVICLTKTTYRQYFNHLCNFHPNCYVPEVLCLLSDNWKNKALTVLRTYVKDKLTPFLNDILKINNQFALFYRIAKTDELLMKNGEAEFEKFKQKKLIFNEPTKESIKLAYDLKKKGNIARYGNEKKAEKKEKRQSRKAKPVERLNEKYEENEGNEESDDEDIKTK
jgi:hypothetical protein